MQKSSAIVDLSSASCQACASSFLGGTRPGLPVDCGALLLCALSQKPLSRRPRRMKNSRFTRALQSFASPVLVRAKPHFPGAAPRQDSLKLPSLVRVTDAADVGLLVLGSAWLPIHGCLAV